MVAAARISKIATDRGTWIHDIAEKHFNGEDVSEVLRNAPSDVRQMSKDLITTVASGVEEIWGQEQVLWSNKLKYAGRTDMVGIWKGKPTIIDFKTSRKLKKKQWIEDYFMQATFYSMAFFELTNYPIKDIAILISVNKGEDFQVFHEKVGNWMKPLHSKIKEYKGIFL